MKTMRRLMIVLCGWCAGAIVFTAMPVMGAADAPARSIVVLGTGEIKAAPDLVTIRAGVVTQATAAKAALDENSQRMKQVLEALKTFGVPEGDIQTARLTINPQRERKRAGESKLPNILGYTVVHQVVVTLRQMERLGPLLDQLVSLGVNQFSDIQFAIDEPETLLDKARTAAVEDAQRKAELMSRAAGVVLGNVLTIRETGRQRPQPRFAARMATAEGVPVAAGTETLSVTVEVRFALESSP